MPDLVPWAASLETGTRRIFGFLQVDVARHSTFAGAGEIMAATLSKLHKHVSAILGQHDAQEMFWRGDGGAYLFLLDAGRRVDAMVVGGLQVLDGMRLFNNLHTLNAVGTPLTLRISCHLGGAIWNSDMSHLYGRDVNYFLKAEREIGNENRLTLTEEAYNDLTTEELRQLFTSQATHMQYSLSGRPYERDIYVSRPVDTIPRQDQAMQDGIPPSVGDIVPHLRSASRIDFFGAGGDTFFRILYEALWIVGGDNRSSLRLRVLLRRSSSASQRSAKQFLALRESHGIDVEVRFYDWDFMIRGYSFDDTVFFSYYLREGELLTGRYNPMVLAVHGTSAIEDFLIAMYTRVFDAHFDVAPGHGGVTPILEE